VHRREEMCERMGGGEGYERGRKEEEMDKM